MTQMDKEYIEKEYEQAIKEYNAALTEDDLEKQPDKTLSASLPQRTAPAIHFSAYTTAFQSVFLPYSHHLFLPSKTPIGGLYYQYSLLHIFDLLKKGWFSLRST